MAGVLKTIAKQLQGKRIEDTIPKRVPSSKRKRYVAPKVGPENISEKFKKESEINKDITLMPQEIQALCAEENKMPMGNDDYLLAQIDEFREKAQQLQNLLLAKENRVAELQDLVTEQEGKARELEDIIMERQSQADGIAEEMAKEVTKEVTAEINSQIDTIIGKVTAKLVAMENVIRKDLEEGQSLTEEQFSEILSALEETLPALNMQLEVLKEDLSEKVHSENTKGYHKVSDLVKNLEDKMDVLKDTEQSVERKADAVHKCVILLVVFSVFNFLGIAAMILLEMGIFQLV